MTGRAVVATTLALAAALTAGCGDAEGPESGPAPVPGRENAPRWTLEPLWTSSDTLLLSGVLLMAPDSRGRLYVYDMDLGVLLLGGNGSVVRKIGREGEGPGEHLWIGHLQVIEGDTVLLWDSRQGRLSAFDPDSGRFAYDRSFGRRTTTGNGRLFGPPRWVHRSSGAPERYVAANASFVPPGGNEEDRAWVVRILDGAGVFVRDSILVFPPGESVAVERGRTLSIFNHPLGHQGLVRVGPEDRLHYAHTDTPRVRILDLEGRSIGGFELLRERRPVTEEDLERTIEGMSRSGHFADVAEELAEGIREGAPERHPIFRDFLVDDGGRIWIPASPRRTDPDRPFEWEVHSDEGDLLGIVPVERGRLETVRGDRAYGVSVDSLGVPTIWAATIRTGDRGP